VGLDGAVCLCAWGHVRRQIDGMAGFPHVVATLATRCEPLAEADDSLDPLSFHAAFVLTNTPCILRGLCQNWPALREWTRSGGTEGSGAAPDVEELCRRFGNALVPVVSADVAAGYGDGRTTVLLREFLTCDLLGSAAPGPGQAPHTTKEAGAPPSDSSLSCKAGTARPALRYMKDWHFVRERPEAAAGAYAVPDLFADDWLNGWHDDLAACRGGGSGGDGVAVTGCCCGVNGGPCQQGGGATHDVPAHIEQVVTAAARCSSGGDGDGGGGLGSDGGDSTHRLRSVEDYRFVYMGGSGTWTPLHHDVLASHSWSVNVCGAKVWLFAPPEASAALLYDAWGDLRWSDLRTPREKEALDAAAAAATAAAGVTAPASGAAAAACPLGPPQLPLSFCVQQRGDAVFVPSGWHHQVHNIGATISINHNWLNGASLGRVAAFLAGELARVRSSIADCRTVRARACIGAAGQPQASLAY
jgi:hypothetical protein